MTYFINHIYQFNTTNGYNLLNKETAHKYAIKAYQNQINK